MYSSKFMSLGSSGRSACRRRLAVLTAFTNFGRANSAGFPGICHLLHHSLYDRWCWHKQVFLCCLDDPPSHLNGSEYPGFAGCMGVFFAVGEGVPVLMNSGLARRLTAPHITPPEDRSVLFSFLTT